MAAVAELGSFGETANTAMNAEVNPNQTVRAKPLCTTISASVFSLGFGAAVFIFFVPDADAGHMGMLRSIQSGVLLLCSCIVSFIFGISALQRHERIGQKM